MLSSISQHAARAAGAGRAVVFVLAALVAAGAARPAAAEGEPAPTVVVAPVTAEEVGQSGRYIGRVQAIQSVDLKARVEGFLETVDFKEGGMVDPGALLFEIEQAPYTAAVAEAEAAVAAARAEIAATEARLKNADTVLTRQNELLRRGTVSQATQDDAQASRDLAAADVEKAKAQEKQALAQLATAKLNLSYTKVTAPIRGRIGATNVTAGNLVNTQTGTLATIVQLDPIRVAFSIPEALYVKIAESRRGVSATEQAVVPRLVLPTGARYEPAGAVAFASNQIDPATGTLVVYADFPNEQGALLPGAFVSVEIETAQRQRLPVVPAAAVLRDRQGQYVFVVGTDDRAQQRRIETGPRTSTGVAVTSGVAEGESVIVAGVQKVRPGSLVSPTAQTSPIPATAGGQPAPAASNPAPAAPATSAPAPAAPAASTPAPAATDATGN